MDDKQVNKAKLRRVRLKNFVKYKSEQTLDFDQQNGNVFTFVGSNGSGKSCLFEAIRRCMDSKNTVSLSSMCDEDEESIVVCTFEKEVKDKSGNCKLASVYMNWIKDTERHSIKCLVSETTIEVPILYSKLDTRKPQIAEWEEYCIQLNKDTISTLLNYETTLDIKATILKKLPGEIGKLNKKPITVKSEKKFDKNLKEFVLIEFIFPIRPLGSIQSTAQLETSDKTSRYSAGTRHSYIITNYLEKGSLEYNTVMEKRIFEILTGGETFNFSIKDDVLIVASETSELAIWKTPEGVLEAKYASVTLSNTKTDILLFEEPGRGMHQQMTDRLVNLVFSDKSLMGNKTVFLTTHNKDFLTHRSLMNTFLCVRTDQKTSEIKAASDLQGTDKETRQYISSGIISLIVFSQKVLFVEGESDFTFIETLKHILLTDKDLLRQLGDTWKTVYTFLANLSIGRLYGCCNVRKINQVFKKLGMLHNRYFLLDFDTIKNIDEILDLNLTESPYFDLKRLEESGVFLWDDDEVESVDLVDDETRTRKLPKGQQSRTRIEPGLQSPAEIAPPFDAPKATSQSTTAKPVGEQASLDHANVIGSKDNRSGTSSGQLEPNRLQPRSETSSGIDMPAIQTIYSREASVTELSTKFHHKGTQCTGMAKSDKDGNIKPGTIEDVVVRFSIQHDLKYHNTDTEINCDIQGCRGLLKMLEDKNIANAKIWKTYGFKAKNHKKYCMMGKFLIQNLSYEHVIETVQVLVKTAIRYREGQIWRFLMFLIDKAGQ